MLMITRHPGEWFRLTIAGEEVWISLAATQRKRCKFAIVAPRSVEVLRAELVDESERPEFVNQPPLPKIGQV